METDSIMALNVGKQDNVCIVYTYYIRHMKGWAAYFTGKPFEIV